MKRSLMIFTFVLSALTLATTAQTIQAAGTKLKKGDRIVFLGDSITQAGARPGGFVTLVREAIDKKHKDLGIEVIGAGISGHKVPDLQKRLDRDVISKKPTVVVIYIGINDVWHSQNGNGTSKEDFSTGLHDIIKRIRAAGARVILCTPSMIGEKTDGSNKLDKMLEEYSAISRTVAADTKSQMLDLRKAFVGHLKHHNPDAKERGVLTSDGVHLNAKGNRFVARQMLTALGVKTAAHAHHDHGHDHEHGHHHGKVLRHVVLFSFKAESSKDDVKEIVTEFGKLKSKIKQIKGYEWGTDMSPEKLADGFTHCFIVTFHSAKDRDDYLPHPSHKEFVKLVGPHVEKVLVVDFWAQK